MKSQYLENIDLPDAPGVYFFKDKVEKILYIGRATSIRDRVKSYFGNDLIETRGPLLIDMMTKAVSIDHKETDSVLEAIILESNLIKEHQPYFNTKEKDNRSYNYIVITDEEFGRVMMVRGRTLEIVTIELRKWKIKYQFGPYPQGSLLREALAIIRKIFPFRDAKAFIPHQESFYKSLGLSPKIDSPEEKKEYQKTIRNLNLFFQGKKKELMKTLEKEMTEYAKEKKFEMAEKTKRTLYALSHIQDVALIKSDQTVGKEGFRIEAYDIAHFSGKDVVGVMTVAYGNEIEKSQYKKFKLSKNTNDDTGNLREILTRRLRHSEWGMPDLVVIDGGMGQLNTAKEVLDSYNLKIPIISVVKNSLHKPDHFLGDSKLVSQHKDIILKLNAEAHRFGIAYHKNLRKRNFLKPITKKRK